MILTVEVMGRIANSVARQCGNVKPQVKINHQEKTVVIRRYQRGGRHEQA